MTFCFVIWRFPVVGFYGRRLLIFGLWDLDLRLIGEIDDGLNFTVQTLQ